MRLLYTLAMKRILAMAILTACGTTSGTDSSPYGPGMGTPENPVPAQSNEGPYTVTTKVDLTVEAILPQQAEDIVAAMRDFSTNPAHAMLTLAAQESVPALADLYDVLPSQLTGKLEDWINGYVDGVSVGGKPLTKWAGDFAALADTAFSQFNVDSTLAIDGATSTHVLTQLDFTPTGVLNVKIPITGIASDILTQHPSIAVGEGGAFQVGDQAFGLLFGEYAWQAVNNECKSLFGADIRGTLGKAVNCPALAKSISNKCVLFVCVGHESLLNDVCEGGLDAVVQVMHDKFSSYNIEALHYASGAATLVDSDGDGVADQITTGTWDAEMNLGLGLRHTPASWTGERPTNAAQ
jgi:hypothetical protein